MSKKAILSALLVSSALLGTASANAATSALKDESKLVSVEKDGVKIYNNSKLESSKKVAKGTVYKVDGYRDINSKKYYRVYQEDSKGKNTYKGYILAKDAQDLKAGSVDKKDRFVGLTEDGQKAWKNLYFNREIKTYNGKKHSSNFEVKRTYEIGGKKYFSLYRGEKWMGYMDGSAFKVLTPENVEEGKQAYTVAKDAKTYNDIYFTEKGELKAGEKVTVKRVYTFGTGRKYASAYNAEGKWVGYVNLSLLSEDKVVDEETQKAIDTANEAIKKAEEILSKAQASKESKEAAQKVIDAAKETVKNGNLEDIKKVPSQIEEAIKALKPGATTIDIQKVEEAIKAGEDAIKQATSEGIGSVDQPKIDALKKAIEEGKKVVADMKKGDASSEDADKAVEAIKKAINDLKLPATTVDIEKLQEAIKEGTAVVNGTVSSAVSGRDELNKAIEEGKKVLESAKKGEANGQDVADAIKAIEDAMNNVKLNKQALFDEAQSLQKLAKDVYMTGHGEAQFIKAMTDIMNLPDSGVNFPEYEEAKDVLANAKKGLEAQPNKADADALIAQLKDTKKLAKLPNNGKDLAGIDKVEKAYKEARRIFIELDKDQPKENAATAKITKAQVAKATKDLKDALAALKLDTNALNIFIDAAQKLAENDGKLSNNAEFAKQVEALKTAAKDTSLSNYANIVKAAQTVYQTMVQDLDTVIKGVLPWNNNSYENNPKVDPVVAVQPKEVKEDGSAVAGDTLDPKVFAENIIKTQDTVGDYYTKASYDAFMTALGNAETLVKDAQSKDKVELPADEMAQSAVKINVAMDKLVKSQEDLRFDREKLAAFSQAGHDAVQKWANQNTGKKSKDAVVTDVAAQAKEANKGFWALGYKVAAKQKEEAKTEWNDKNSFLATAKDEDFKPTKENAEKITKLVYAAENGYYEYIQTVKAPSEKGE